MRSSLWIVTGIVGIAAAGGFAHASRSIWDMRPAPQVPLAHVDYAPQKVVYHYNQGGGWFGAGHRRAVQVLQNHVAALRGALTLRVVLQGEGVDLLTLAKQDEKVRASVDRLRAAGVRFIVCRNSLVGRKLDLAALHGARPDDIAPAAVAEIADLVGKGFVYLKL
jgi:hypothetical protein